MYCLKCGRDTKEGHVFCDRCQDNMIQYPVKPGTAVNLPHRKDEPAPKKPVHRKRAIPPEEQIQNLKRNLRRSRTFGLVMLIALCLAGVLLIREFANAETPIIGQNYTIDLNLRSK